MLCLLSFCLLFYLFKTFLNLALTIILNSNVAKAIVSSIVNSLSIVVTVSSVIVLVIVIAGDEDGVFTHVNEEDIEIEMSFIIVDIEHFTCHLLSL